MGKRKRRTDPNKAPPSDVMQQSSQMEASSEQKSSDQVKSSAIGPISSILEIMDDSVKLPQVSQLPAHHQHFSRAMLLRNPRYCSRKYYRRNSGNRADASTSSGKVTPSIDENIFLKFANKYRSDDCSQHTENWDQAFLKPERIRSSSFSTDAVSHDVGKMACRICERLLRKKPYINGGIGSSSDLSVVAVLVCGHVYHADCLEQKTSQEEQMDPPCPTCASLMSKVED
ncbi:unnamed protein product [Coffea canephora]|uniref:RING-type domain-containing protein n=2 Tax=Coffea TaxID=13442 RepID=A0A068US69_COFCA|nr:uncharacterized protein LOC113691894 isoform X1 [Coffea arabica]CDP10478.1 unnamed protein product [Coffea canephora]